MLTLYFSPGASSMAPHIALYEIGVPFEAKPLSFAKNDLRTREFLALNPEGKVPTLLIDGRPLTEVAAILFYLARRYPEAHLLPHGDAEAEAQVISWMSFVASSIHPVLRLRNERTTQAFGYADGKLAGREWAVGRYSIADMHLFRLYWRYARSVKPDRAIFPNLSAHHDRMMQRPAVQRTFEAEAAIGYDLPW